MRAVAFRILEDATSSMALVMCRVESTERIRARMALEFPGMAYFSPSMTP